MWEKMLPCPLWQHPADLATQESQATRHCGLLSSESCKFPLYTPKELRLFLLIILNIVSF